MCERKCFVLLCWWLETKVWIVLLIVPMVGMVVTTSPSFNLYRMVVLPEERGGRSCERRISCQFALCSWWFHGHVCVCSQNNQHLVPAASRPTIRMRHSFLPKRPLNKPLKTEPMVAGWKQHKRKRGTSRGEKAKGTRQTLLFGLKEVEGHCYTQPHTLAPRFQPRPHLFSLPLSLSLPHSLTPQ